jgi:hypothetical protein
LPRFTGRCLPYHWKQKEREKLPEYEIMLVVETSVTYTVEAEDQADAIAEAKMMFSPSDLDVHESDITDALVETEPGSSYFVSP